MGLRDTSGQAGRKIGNIGRLFSGIDTPSISEQQLLLEQYVEQGVLTPEEAQAYLVEQDGFNNMDLDVSGKQAQLQALESLTQLGQQGGMNNMDRAALQQIQSQEQTQARGAREAIMQGAQQRGAGGSGMELLQQMQNQQEAVTRQSNRDLGVAGMAQQRALEALQAGGQLGGQVNQQQFGQQAQKANAANAIAQFNANNSQQMSLANTGAKNAAQATNLAAKQGLANANVNIGNQQQQYNKELEQKGFNNTLDLAKARAGATESDEAARQAKRDAALKLAGTGISTAATLFGGG